MFNLPNDIINLIMDFKIEAEQKDNKKKMLIELNNVISYAKYEENDILSVYEQYKNIY